MYQIPDDAVSVGYIETSPYQFEQVFHSSKNGFTGTEREFVEAGLGYEYREMGKHTRLVI